MNLDKMRDWNHYRVCGDCRLLRRIRVIPDVWTQAEINEVESRAAARWNAMQEAIID